MGLALVLVDSIAFAKIWLLMQLQPHAIQLQLNNQVCYMYAFILSHLINPGLVYYVRVCRNVLIQLQSQLPSIRLFALID